MLTCMAIWNMTKRHHDCALLLVGHCRYGAHLLHQYYSSQHLGTCLADAVVRLFTDPLASR